jgi:hypothetical protein
MPQRISSTLYLYQYDFTVLSLISVALVVYTWFRTVELLRDDRVQIRWPGFLIVPLICFGISTISGYLIEAMTADGAAFEATGRGSGTDVIHQDIYFVSPYSLEALLVPVLIQLTSISAGLILFLIWFTINIFAQRR